jgi:hypothetical protein
MASLQPLLRLLSLSLLLSPIAGWQAGSIFPRINMSCPVPQINMDLVIDSTVVVDPEWYDVKSPTYDGFPCSHVPIPPNVQRTPFPIIGGTFQLNFTSPDPSMVATGIIPPAQCADPYWTFNVYFGQFGGNETLSQNGYAPIDTYTWKCAEWQFGTYTPRPPGWPVLNMSEALERSDVQTVPLPADLDGLEATLAIVSIRFTPDDNGSSGTGDQMLQCAYVRFSSAIDQTPGCSADTIRQQSGDTSSSSSTALPTSSTVGTGGPLFTGTGTGNSNPPPIFTTSPSGSVGQPAPDSSSSSHTSIGVGVGISVAVLSALGILMFVIRKMHYKGRALRLQLEAAAPPDIETAPMPEDKKDPMFKDRALGKRTMGEIEAAERKGKEKELAEKKDDRLVVGKDDDAASVAPSTAEISVRSEQLPSYSQAVDTHGKK